MYVLVISMRLDCCACQLCEFDQLPIFNLMDESPSLDSGSAMSTGTRRRQEALNSRSQQPNLAMNLGSVSLYNTFLYSLNSVGQ